MGTPTPDRVELHAGDDTAFGRAGADRIFGATDGDRLYGEDGRDTLSCGEGEDTVYLSGSEHSGHNIDDSCENVTSY